MIILGDTTDLEKVGPRGNVLELLGTYLEGDTPSLFLTVSIVITALLHAFLL